MSAGLTEQTSGNTGAAAGDYQSVVAKCPASSDAAYAYYDLGVIEQVDHNDAAAAETDYENALAIDGSQPDAYFNLAVLLTKQSPKRAIRDYTKAIALFGPSNPASAASYLNRGFLEISLGDTKAGRSDQAEAVKLDPSLASRLKQSSKASG